MKGSRSSYLWILIAALWTLPALADETELSVELGASKTLKIAGLRRISIANPRVADVRVVDGEVILNGVGAGRTSLIVWKRNGQRLSYRVVVVSEATTQAFEEIKHILADVEGVKVSLLGEHIFLEGTVYSLEDAVRVEKAGRLYPDRVRSSVKLDGVPLEDVVR